MGCALHARLHLRAHRRHVTRRRRTVRNRRRHHEQRPMTRRHAADRGYCVVPPATALEPPSCIREVSSEVVAVIRCIARPCVLLTRGAIEVLTSPWTWLIGIA